MTLNIAFAITVWAIFIFIWLPVSYVKYRKRLRSLRAINKGYRFSKKYLVIRRLTRSDS